MEFIFVSQMFSVPFSITQSVAEHAAPRSQAPSQ